MKKRIQVIMIAAFMLMVTGCGSNTLSGSVKEVANGTGSGIVAAGSAGDIANSTQTPSLDVENDAFTFEELTLKIGATEADVLSLIGAKDKSEAYTVTLFGKSAEVVLTSENDTISSIKLTFADTDAESLANAISEQLAQDGESSGGGTKWTYESSTVTLSTSDKGCVVEITKK